MAAKIAKRRVKIICNNSPLSPRPEDDEAYMRRCIQLARMGEAGAAPNPMVGAVVVCRGQIIGEGFHRKCGGPHAEVHAIRSVKQPEMLSRSTLYVSLEPCAHYGKTPPCAELIARCGIPRVVVGCADPFARVDGRGIRMLREAGAEVVVGVLEEECLALNRPFMATARQALRPWVTLKWAQSADGFIAREDGGAVQFSTPLTRALAHRLRARCQAIMVGTHTALWDNPTLTVRHWHGPNPLRVTIDRHGVLPPTLHLLDEAAPTMVFHHEDLPAILSQLRGRGVQHLLVEGGAELHRQFLAQGLCDEIRVETAPVLLGRGIRAAGTDGFRLQNRLECQGNVIRLFRPARP